MSAVGSLCMSAALFVSAGQSNEVGYKVSADQFPREIIAPNPHVFMFDPATGQKVLLQAGVNTGTPNQPTAVGPEVAFAYRWSQLHPGQDLVFVKVARGETGLEKDPSRPDWSPDSRGELFDQTAAAIKQAESALNVKLSGVLWMQGEEDASRASAAKAYEANLRLAFRRMRRDWGDSATPIVFGRISATAGLPFAGAVRAAQDRVARADRLAIEVSTDGFAVQEDRLHYSAAGQVSLGFAFHDAWRRASAPATGAR